MAPLRDGGLGAGVLHADGVYVDAGNPRRPCYLFFIYLLFIYYLFICYLFIITGGWHFGLKSEKLCLGTQVSPGVDLPL